MCQIQWNPREDSSQPHPVKFKTAILRPAFHHLCQTQRNPRKYRRQPYPVIQIHHYMTYDHPLGNQPPACLPQNAQRARVKPQLHFTRKIDASEHFQAPHCPYMSKLDHKRPTRRQYPTFYQACKSWATENRTQQLFCFRFFAQHLWGKFCSTVQYIQSSTTQRTFNAPCNHQATLMAQTALAQVRTRITPG